MAIFIIEHLEPRLWEWCLIEYESISKLVGKENLWFTNVKNPQTEVRGVPGFLSTSKIRTCEDFLSVQKKDMKKLENLGRIFSCSVSELKLNNACVLDPEAGKLLSPEDKFDYFIFGGILGDNPPRKRTRPELTSKIKAEARNIGKEQLATDNAVFVVKQVSEGKKISELKFSDEAVIKVNNAEEIILPYRYVLVDGKPFMSEKIVRYLRKKKGF